MFLQRRLDELPRAFEILFTVFWEKRGETRLFGEGTGGVVFGCEGLNLDTKLANMGTRRRFVLRAPSTCRYRQYPMACPHCVWTALWRFAGERVFGCERNFLRSGSLALPPRFLSTIITCHLVHITRNEYAWHNQKLTNSLRNVWHCSLMFYTRTGDASVSSLPFYTISNS